MESREDRLLNYLRNPSKSRDTVISNFNPSHKARVASYLRKNAPDRKDMHLPKFRVPDRSDLELADKNRIWSRYPEARARWKSKQAAIDHANRMAGSESDLEKQERKQQEKLVARARRMRGDTHGELLREVGRVNARRVNRREDPIDARSRITRPISVAKEAARKLGKGDFAAALASGEDAAEKFKNSWWAQNRAPFWLKRPQERTMDHRKLKNLTREESLSQDKYSSVMALSESLVTLRDALLG